MFRRAKLGWLILILSGPLFAGCGGGGGGGGVLSLGKVGVSISWPGRSRYVPPYANSVVCKLDVTGGSTYSLTVNRSGNQASQATVLFPQDVPAGGQTLSFTAYSELDGQGQAVAFATTIVNVTPGRTSTVDMTADLQSTIDHLVIDGQPLSVVTSATLQLAAHGVDTANKVILLPQGALTWDVTAGTQYGSVNATTGLFTPSSVGTAAVRARETGAGKSAQANVTVTGPSVGGTVTVKVDWPGRSRYVPPYANSLVCDLTVSASEHYSLTIDRSGDGQSTGSATFPQSFQAGSYVLTVTAMSQTAGAGQAVAAASTTVTVQAGQGTTKNVTADLQSTIHHLEIDGQPLTVEVPATLTIQGHAEDSAGNTILLPQGSLTWDVTAGGGYGSINSVTGVFTSSAAGTATVRLREVGAAKSVTAPVAVTGGSSSQTIYVMDSGNARIVKMDSISGSGWQGLATAATWGTGVAVDSSGRIYWVDAATDQVCRSDSSGGNIVRYGSNGTGTGQFDGASAVAVDSQQRIYVVDKYNNRLVRMDDMSGAGWTEVGDFGLGDGFFYVPQGVCIGPNDEIYVADTGNSRIVKFTDMSPTGWESLGDYRGNGVGQFDDPVAIAVTSAGIFIADSMNYRIVKVADMAGTGWTTLGGPSSGSGTGAFNYPTGVAVDSSGRIYVSDYLNDRLVRVNDISGSGWTSLGTTGSGTNQFSGPKGVAVK